MATSDREKTIVEKIQELAETGESHEIGKHFGLLSKGWIAIADHGSFWSVHYTNSKESHNRGWGPSFMADFEKVTGERRVGPGYLTGAWQSAITMHPVIDETKAKNIFDHMSHLVDESYHHKMKHAAPVARAV